MLEAQQLLHATHSRAGRRLAAFRDNTVSAFRALTQNWLRSLLTLTGIVIGMLAIVTLIAILQGVKVEIRKQVEGLGTNLVLVVPGKLDENGQPNPGALAGISSLTEADVDALRRVPGVEKISPVYVVAGSIEVGSEVDSHHEAEGNHKPGKGSGHPTPEHRTPEHLNTGRPLADKPPTPKAASAFVVATNKVGVQMNPTRMAEGRYFEAGEGQVCILGYRPRHDLFGDAPVLGLTVRIQNHNWKVIGVLSKPDPGGSLGSTLLALNNLVYVPADTVMTVLPGSQVNRIVLQTDYKHPAEKLATQLNQALLTAHEGHEDFGVITQEKGLGLVIHILNMAQALLVLIAGISLFVAGVGIMNIMLVTVTERTREIGVRKTVGARRGDIFLQFLTEAVVLSLVGGLIGLVCSWGVCKLVARFSPLTPIITWQLVGLAMSVCVGVGVLFGVAPAIRAARLSPIEALRHE